jgi:aryl-alcohol dehydrogenase-like predicted oxidoreductase
VTAARRAATGPHPWVDTAPNYHRGRAHRLLAPVLAGHPAMGVSTEVGIIPAAAADEVVRAGVLDQEAAAGGHSLTPAYLRWQLDRNRADLGQDRLDVVFVHNPERAGPDTCGQLAAAFGVLEREAAAGRISGYGVATWNGFASGALTVSTLLETAWQAAGGGAHHLVAVQLPISLVLADPLAVALKGRGPVAEAAAAGLEVYASAPLYGGELVGLATKELAGLIRPGLSIAGACLLAVASCPGVSRVLLSASTAAHWENARVALEGEPLAPAHLRRVLDVLAPI